jgi:PleD family two-component response regulator
MMLMVMITAALIIVLFEVIPERSVWSIPEGIQEVDEHMIAVPAYSAGLSLLHMQKQGEAHKDTNKELYCEKQHRHSKKKILIVDDKSDVEKALRDKGFEHIYTPNDPLLFLKNYEPNSYDLLLIGAVMQQMDGFTLFKEIRKIDHKIRVCFITGYSVNYQAMRDIFSDDIECFIQRPVDIDSLIEHIERELG